jgi:5'-nucleotidase
VGLKGELIHMFNKNETAVCHKSYFEDLTHRPNVLLMGDSTGDSRMAEGVVNANVVLKIGFLNTKVINVTNQLQSRSLARNKR